ncbi:unnamed protein product [Dovyalis caffra]|uniref:Uncharacterized protein n=1 Tax=Dovyalis caffra TaxID=77055 RepID=A0AAV1RDY8_9ROSI|nr:unnamed protein product [Dovyalis caffra]
MEFALSWPFMSRLPTLFKLPNLDAPVNTVWINCDQLLHLHLRDTLLGLILSIFSCHYSSIPASVRSTITPINNLYNGGLHANANHPAALASSAMNPVAALNQVDPPPESPIGNLHDHNPINEGVGTWSNECVLVARDEFKGWPGVITVLQKFEKEGSETFTAENEVGGMKAERSSVDDNDEKAWYQDGKTSLFELFILLPSKLLQGFTITLLFP